MEGEQRQGDANRASETLPERFYTALESVKPACEASFRRPGKQGHPGQSGTMLDRVCVYTTSGLPGYMRTLELPVA